MHVPIAAVQNRATANGSVAYQPLTAAMGQKKTTTGVTPK